MSQVLEIELSDDLAAMLEPASNDLGAEFRLAAAVKWYELGRLSQGKAAEVAGLSRAAFISELERFQVSPFQESADEVIAGLQSPKR